MLILNLADYFRTRKMDYQPVVFDTADQTVKGFEAGRCDVLTSDQLLPDFRLPVKEIVAS